MAENSGVTTVDIEQKLKASLDATHVEIEDMSGMSSFFHLPSAPSTLATLRPEYNNTNHIDCVYRWLRPNV